MKKIFFTESCLTLKNSSPLKMHISIFNPSAKSIIFLCSIAEFSPFLPLIGGGKQKFSPIYVGDVAQAIVKALKLKNSAPKIYELGGPKDYSFKELMEILLTEIKKKRFLIPIPFGFAKFQSYFLQMLPNPLLTPDQVELLKHHDMKLTGGKLPTEYHDVIKVHLLTVNWNSSNNKREALAIIRDAVMLIVTSSQFMIQK